MASKKKQSRKKKNKKNKTMKKCESFCRDDYMVETGKMFKKRYEEYNKIPLPTPSKKDNALVLKSCKQMYCNKPCKYDFYGNKQAEQEFKKKIKNGFQTSMSKERIRMLKKKGALSGCMNIDTNLYLPDIP